MVGRAEIIQERSVGKEFAGRVGGAVDGISRILDERIVLLREVLAHEGERVVAFGAHAVATIGALRKQNMSREPSLSTAKMRCESRVILKSRIGTGSFRKY